MRRLALAGLALALAGCPGREPPSPRPPSARRAAPGNGYNILLITIDTLRADHLGAYGYARSTSPNIDALARAGTLFEQAYTFWPKTRGSFVMMMTGRRPSLNGYSKTHPVILDFNPTLASVLQEAGYETAATVDNANVAAQLGYGKGFASYRETWEEKGLSNEVSRMRAITESGLARLRSARPEKTPWFLWLHYVNPHTPYTPPAPFDRKFLDSSVAQSRRLAVVDGHHGGLPKAWVQSGQDRLGYYVAQYDGEIATVDAEVGRLLEVLQGQKLLERTVVVLTSDHGESLGKHDYYFDHGENLFDPSLAVPLIVAAPGGPAGRRSPVFASTLDVLPTILDAVKVSYPPDLSGQSLLAEVASTGAGPDPGRERLFAQNDRNLSATFDRQHKLVATPQDDGGATLALYERGPAGETRDVARARPEVLRQARRELETYQERGDREWGPTRSRVQGKPGEGKMSGEACEQLRALGYAGVAGCGF